MTAPIKTPKKLIEVALPLDKINEAAAYEKMPGIGAHPRGLHLWWARRPLAAARAVIFAQMVNDPGYQQGGGFKYGVNKEKAAIERERLFTIIEDLVKWENTNNEEVLNRARAEIIRSWQETCELNKNHPQAAELFNPNKLPAFHDPFAGGGALPLEAQRLGLESYASDLNPVAVTINKAMIEIPPKFAGKEPINPDWQNLPNFQKTIKADWKGARGLAEDVRYYGAWMREQAQQKIGHLYPKVRVTPEMAKERPDLAPLVGQELTVIAWLWARTVKSPNPAFSHVDVPLVSTFILSSKAGKEAYVEPIVQGDSYRFSVKVGTPPASAKGGTTAGKRGGFLCVLSQSPMDYNYIRAEGSNGKMGNKLMAIVAEGVRGRVYLSPDELQESIAKQAQPEWKPEVELHGKCRVNVANYGMDVFGDLFTPRQLVALTTFSDLVQHAIEKAKQDYLNAQKTSPSPFMERGPGGEVNITGNTFVSAEKLNFAKQMRQLPTQAEEHAWQLLRNRQIHGLKFRRQQVIQGFIVDFYCAELRLALELDGEIHAQQQEYDQQRDQYLNQLGVTVVRIPNQQVSKEGLEKLLPHPQPLSINGEGSDDELGLDAGGTGATAYAQAVGVYLGFVLDRCADFSNSATRWVAGNQKVMNLFGKQAIAMTWDYPEAAILHNTVGGFLPAAEFIADCINKLAIDPKPSFVEQKDAQTQTISLNKVISTDPPYYDNIGYADLSDFFYVWLRKSLRPIFPNLYATLAVPKAEELVATPYRHGSKDKAEAFFLDGMTAAMHNLAEQAHPAFPVTIYYAFKQSETNDNSGTSNTGWDTFLEAVLQAGFAITGTWPMRSEQTERLIGKGTNALASSIVLVCKKRDAQAQTVSRREFIRELNAALPEALLDMTRGGVNSPVAPVDLSQAIIGPGMAIFSQYAAVLEADGSKMPVRTALQLINRFLAEDDFDHDTQFCLAWFDNFGWSTGKYGDAETLTKAKGTSVAGLVEAGVVESSKGELRLLKWAEYPSDWSPETDNRTPIWEALHHLIRAVNQQGESAAGALMARMPERAEPIRSLAYRLYTLCERKGWAEDARAYNELVTAWTGIEQAANETGVLGTQIGMDY